jgi:hypothetical protein
MLLLKQFHDDLSHAHGNKLYLTLKNKFYFRNMYAECLIYARTCQVCQKIKGATITPAPLRNWRVGKLFSQISLDHHGPIGSNNATHAFKYVLVITDHFSGNTRYIAVKDMSAKTTCEAIINHWISHYGIPERIITDCAQTYLSQLTQELFKMLGIKHITVAPYSPNSNGRVEHMNCHFLKCIRSLGPEKLNEWPSFLPMIEFAQRIQFSKALQASPFYVMYCTEARTNFDAKYLPNQDNLSPTMNDQFLPRVKLMRDVMKKNLDEANYQTMSAQHKKAKVKTLNIGDRVYRKSHQRTKGVTASHTFLFQGPYTVIEKSHPNAQLVRLQDTHTGKIEKFQTHLNQLKRIADGRDYLLQRYESSRRATSTDGSAADVNQSRHGGNDSDRATPAIPVTHTPHDDNRPKLSAARHMPLFNTLHRSRKVKHLDGRKVGGQSRSDAPPHERADRSKLDLKHKEHIVRTKQSLNDQRAERVEKRDKVKQVKANANLDKNETKKHGQIKFKTLNTNIQTPKIIQRRKIGKKVMYKIQLAHTTEWLSPEQINQTSLSEYNLQRYQKLCEKRKRRTLSLNQSY